MRHKKLNISLLSIEYFLFFLYLVLFYIYGNDGSKLIYSETVLVLLCSFGLLNFIKTKSFRFSLPIVFSILLSLFCFASSLWAIDSSLAVGKGKTLLFLSLFYLVSYNLFISDKNNAIKVVKVIMYAGVVFSIYILMYYGISQYFNLLISGVRIGSEINNVNGIGLTIVISFLMSIFLFKYESKKYIIFSILLAIITIGTGSRTALLQLLFAIVLIMVFDKDKAKLLTVIKKILIIAALAVGILYIINQFSSFDLVNRMIEMTNYVGNSGDVDGSTLTRMKFIQAGFNVFLQHPILGIGGGNSGYITSVVSYGRYTYLHNNYVELLSTLGSIGFLLFYSIPATILIKNFKKKNKSKYTLLAIIMILLMLLGDVGTVSYASKTTIVYFVYGTLLMKEDNSYEENDKKDS